MKTILPIFKLSLLSAALLLTACGTQQAYKQVSDKADAAQTRIDASAGQINSKVSNFKAISEAEDDVALPWLSGKSIPLSKDVTIPEPLRKNVKLTTLQTGCTTNLSSIAGCLSGLIRVPIRIKPDALMPLSAFIPRRSAAAGTGAAAALAPAAPTTTAAVVGTAQPQANTQAASQQFSLQAVEMPLNDLLTVIDSAFSVNHRLADDGAIEFYRLETKNLRLKAMAQTMTASSKLSTGFSDTSTTSFDIKSADPITTMRSTLLAMGTMAGDVMVSPDTKAVTVTDTPEAIARITAYLEEENKRLTRRVTLIVEEILVSRADLSQFSIDWTMVYGKLTGVANTFSSPATLVNANVGKIGWNTQGSGKAAGSGLLIQALNQQGLVAQVRSFPVSTLNGSPYSLSLPTIFDYVDKASTTVAASTTGTIITPSVSQASDKIGTYLTITPDSQDDGQILVSMKFENRSGTLVPYTLTSSGGSVTLQQRNIDEISSIAKTVLRVGVPTVFGGLSEIADESTQRRLGADAPILLGGSDNIKQNKRSLILVVTAIAEDGV